MSDDALDFDLARALSLVMPDADFFLEGNTLGGLEWRDERQRPSVEVLRAAVVADDAARAARKVWETKADFWAEFTESEQLGIMTSAVPGIKLLDRQLLVWPGQVWSDDARVQAGLNGLVAVGILTMARKEAILA